VNNSGRHHEDLMALLQPAETALAELRTAFDGPADFEPSSTLSGPAVPGINSRAISQNDADALLDGLGL
jgi:hypothetical protein